MIHYEWIVKNDDILGAVPEDMIRSKVEDVLKRFPTDEKGSLKRMLTCWTEHNNQHTEKFRRWMEKVKNRGDNSIYNNMIQAAREIEKANERLSQLLIEL